MVSQELPRPSSKEVLNRRRGGGVIDTVATTISSSLLVAILTLVLAMAGVAHAQDGSSPNQGPELTLSGRMWGTSGYSDRKIGAGGLDRLSELRFRGVDSLVPEFNIDVVWRRLVALGAIGGGVIDTGVLIDEDFENSGERSGRTRSSIEDSYLFYVSADIGARVWDWMVPGAAARGYVDLLLGYQYWQEHYEAFGATGFPATVPDGVKALLNKFEWHSLRVGARTQQPLYRGLSLSLRGYFIPWNFVVIKDVHYLRSDLRRDPSFRDEADGGTGWQADGALQYTVNMHLTVEAGFRYWKLESAKGEDIAFTTAGTFRQRLREASTERYGPFVGVRWRF